MQYYEVSYIRNHVKLIRSELFENTWKRFDSIISCKLPLLDLI